MIDIDLKNTKIDFTGKSDSEKIEFQEYCAERGYRPYGEVEQQHEIYHLWYYEHGDNGFTEGGNIDLEPNFKDITEEWANRNKEEPKVYTSSKEDVADAVRDFDIENKERIEVDFHDDGEWVAVNLITVRFGDNNKPYVTEIDGRSSEAYGRNIRKLQKPVNPYEELEENGTYKVVGLSDRTDLDLLWLNYNGVSLTLDEWVGHKDFAGYVFCVDGVMVVYADCWDANLGHAIGVRFKVEKEDE